ncbi:MAG: hypothetical protein JSR67_00710 [Proteobacteria bacterium]|nr:hypothetical protein [Pseudomonadota bacterium]
MILASLACSAFVPLTVAQTVSVNGVITGQIVPGVYGQVVFGNAPPPPLVSPQPVYAVPAYIGAPPMEPMYIYAPPGHIKHWRKHCHEYNACNRPVYFVREPGYRHHGDDDDDQGHDHGRGHWHGHGHDHDD